MQIFGVAVFIIAVLWAGVLSARLWRYRMQIRHMKEELIFLEKEETNRQLSSAGPIGKTEEVISAVNRLISRYREEEIRLRNENRIYRESITSISHDIRTPLTSAKGYAQMLKNAEISEEKRIEYLEIVERRLDDVADMLNQLFEYARIEAGELQPELEVFNAGNLFAETISMFYDDFLKKGCEPEVMIAKEPCRIRADRHAFVRIVENLLKNALVHGTGGYSLSLTKEENRIRIRVSNLTDSILRQDLDRIFDRFYTTDQSRSRKTTGLGLAIVKRFVEQMDGTVEATLEGDRFGIEVRIPLAVSLPDSAEQ